ncbi:MAG: XRE family transcriptional regulator [Azospirillaceae bacterium]|nr:XRE family transcriptional regulator [Azospirillaceae bacterium]
MKEPAPRTTNHSHTCMVLRDHITREGLSQSEAARMFGVTKPLVSDLMRGGATLCSLINMAALRQYSETTS